MNDVAASQSAPTKDDAQWSARAPWKDHPVAQPKQKKNTGAHGKKEWKDRASPQLEKGRSATRTRRYSNRSLDATRCALRQASRRVTDSWASVFRAPFRPETDGKGTRSEGADRLPGSSLGVCMPLMETAKPLAARHVGGIFKGHSRGMRRIASIPVLRPSTQHSQRAHTRDPPRAAPD